MTLWYVPGQGIVDDTQQNLPEYGELRNPWTGEVTSWGVKGIERIGEYENQAQYGRQAFQWDPQRQVWSGGIQENAPGYLTEMLGRLEQQRRGELPSYQIEELNAWQEAARAIPTRDIASLRAGWQGEGLGQWTDNGWQEGNPEWWSLLDPGSPDAGPIMLQLRDKIMHGTATDQERQLYQDVGVMAADWDYRASVPQESDANPFGMGDNLMGALMTIGMGASGGLAAAPLAAGGALTLGSIGGLAGAAGGFTGLMGEALDMDALRKAAIAMGVAGGAAGVANLLQQGVVSVGDVLKLAKGVYSTGTKAYGLATGAGSTPDQPNQGLSAADQRTQRSSSAEGGSMADILDSLGPLLAGAIGAVGAGVSLQDVNRFMDQLKTRYGQEEGVKELIDEAYNLARSRYEIYYADTRQEQIQKQEAYQDALEKYETRYGQQQQQFEKQQQQFEKIEGQTDEDRRTQYESYQSNRQKVDESYNRQVQEAQQERDFQLSQHGADRALVLQSYNQRVQEAQQDRAKQYQTYDQQFARHTQREDQRAAQAVEERGLDLNAYQQRQAIGRNLSDPATIAAGAKGIYEPLSAAARDRINTQTEEEMARRGVAGGGQYSNLMAAKAFAPLEQQMWQNALQAYLTGQQGAASAYTQQDMTMVPGYEWAQRPEFAGSPEYKQMSIPNLAGSPDYRPYNVPQFTQSDMRDVPGAPGYEQRPGAPGAVPYPNAPAVPGSTNAPYYPRPYSPYGSVDGTGGAGGFGDAGTALGNLAPLAKNLTQLLGGNTGLVAQIMKLFSGGNNYQDADIYGMPDPWAGSDYQGGQGDFPGATGDIFAGGSQYFDEGTSSYDDLMDYTTYI